MHSKFDYNWLLKNNTEEKVSVRLFLKKKKKYKNFFIEILDYRCGFEQELSNEFNFRTRPQDQENWSPRIAVYGDMGLVNGQSFPLWAFNLIDLINWFHFVFLWQYFFSHRQSTSSTILTIKTINLSIWLTPNVLYWYVDLIFLFIYLYEYTKHYPSPYFVTSSYRKLIWKKK